MGKQGHGERTRRLFTTFTHPSLPLICSSDRFSWNQFLLVSERALACQNHILFEIDLRRVGYISWKWDSGSFPAAASDGGRQPVARPKQLNWKWGLLSSGLESGLTDPSPSNHTARCRSMLPLNNVLTVIIVDRRICHCMNGSRNVRSRAGYLHLPSLEKIWQLAFQINAVNIHNIISMIGASNQMCMHLH